MNRPRGEGGFAWDQQPWGDALVCEPLAAVAPHLFTTRQLRLRGEPADMAAEWEAIGRSVGVRGDAIVRVHQVHRADVLVIRAGEPRPRMEAAADAIISNDPSRAISVRVADCVPILMADRRTGVVAAVHAGWRGTCASVGPEAVAAMTRHFGTDPADVVAAIGPSIGPCCYEVGSNVVDAFAAAGHQREQVQRWFRTEAVRGEPRERMPLVLDLWTANRDQLLLAGLPESTTCVSALCTATCNDIFFSYRCERDAAGRMAAVIRAINN